MQRYQMFYLPRPWWGWVGRVAPEQQPVDPRAQAVACGLLLVLGSIVIVRSLGGSDVEHDAPGVETLCARDV
jgi:hypothetical protein